MRLRAIVIADDSSVRFALTALFEAEDYDVFSARDHEEGIYLLSGTPVDVVVVDANGHLGRASRTIRRLKSIDADVPVIALANRADADCNEPYPLGDALFFNPVTVAALIGTADKLIIESRARKRTRLLPSSEELFNVNEQ